MLPLCQVWLLVPGCIFFLFPGFSALHHVLGPSFVCFATMHVPLKTEHVPSCRSHTFGFRLHSSMPGRRHTEPYPICYEGCRVEQVSGKVLDLALEASIRNRSSCLHMLRAAVEPPQILEIHYAFRQNAGFQGAHKIIDFVVNTAVSLTRCSFEKKSDAYPTHVTQRK